MNTTKQSVDYVNLWLIHTPMKQKSNKNMLSIVNASSECLNHHQGVAFTARTLKIVVMLKDRAKRHPNIIEMVESYIAVTNGKVTVNFYFRL